MATSKKPAAKKSSASKRVAAPKKAAAKKTAAKKSSAKKTPPKRPLVQAADHESFWTTDGQVLNDLIALHTALKAMDAAVYRYHVTRDRHDFADWVEAVLEDAACATALRRAKTPKSAHTVIIRHLKHYQI